MKQVDILYTKFTQELSEKKMMKLLGLLPLKMQEKNARFHHWKDRQANLFGKLLLLQGLQTYGYKSTVLEKIKYNTNGRPYLNNNIDFNISHSGEYIICAISETTKLGIDIEKITSIDFNNFKSVMNREQMTNITNSKKPIKTFFNYWTIKESCIKADGKGLGNDLLNIKIYPNFVNCNDNKWFIKNIFINQKYCCHIATNKPRLNMGLEYVEL